MSEAGSRQVVIRQYVERRPRVSHPYGVSFMMLSQRGLAEVEERLLDGTLGMPAVRVLVAMMRSMDYENRVDISNKELCARLGMTSGNVSAACKTLVDCGFIERRGSVRGLYRLDPRLCWKGTVKNLTQTLAA